MLEEMSLTSGNVVTRGSKAYVPQEAWILSDSVRENILLGSKHNAEEYQKTLEACALLQVGLFGLVC